MTDNLKIVELEKWEIFYIGNAITLYFDKNSTDIRIYPNFPSNDFIYRDPSDRVEIVENMAASLEYITKKYKNLKNITEFYADHRMMLDIQKCVDYIFEKYEEYRKGNKLNE